MARSIAGLSALLGFVAAMVTVCNEQNPIEPGQNCRLTVIASAGGEIVEPAQSVMEVSRGASATITARPQPGYVFARWTVFGDSAAVVYQNAARATVTVTGNDTIRAEFLAIPKLPGHVDPSGFPTENGANYFLYSGAWTELPDFRALVSDTAGPVDTFGVATLSHGSQKFGALLSAYLSIPLDGTYSFFLTSSDGSALYLNDSLVLLNDGVHAAPKEDSVSLALTTGFYLIEVRYFNAGADPLLSVSYACPDIGIEKMTIPRDALYRADTRPVVRIIVTKPAGGETFRLGDTIHIQWNYKNIRGQVFAQLSVDNGRRFRNISINAFPGNVTWYDWLIPTGADSLVTQTALIRVEEYPPFNVTGTSRVFAIIGR